MKIEKQKSARDLRSQGLSIPEIAKRLDVARSSVSLWVRDIVLREEQKQILRDRRSSFRERVEYNQEKKEAALQLRTAQFEQGRNRAASDPLFGIVCALYWGEGYKLNNKNTFSIANSDKEMILFLVRWLTMEGYGADLRLQVGTQLLNSRTDNEILAFWQHFLNVPSTSFLSVVRSKHNRASQGKNIGKLPFGTINILVHRTRLVQEIFGGIAYLKQNPPSVPVV